MQTFSSGKVAEALSYLEEAAMHSGDALKSMIADKYEHLRDAIIEAESSLADTLSDAKKQTVKAAVRARKVGVKKAHEFADEVDKTVHENPWPHIAGAAVVGVLLGYVIGRSRE